ncbi:MAG TPA: hypothetical protein VFX28_14860 [Methylomirabilota bacterium]|nr:hypothetical protein [Methylomirabilota bacterium]
MSESERETVGVVEDARPEPYGRCQVCGAPHAPADSIFCRACGEPVLLWGWVP